MVRTIKTSLIALIGIKIYWEEEIIIIIIYQTLINEKTRTILII
jgi:hypothetical protein